MATPNNQGGEISADQLGTRPNTVSGRTAIGMQDRAIEKMISGIDKLSSAYEKLKNSANGAAKAMGGAVSNVGSGAGVTSGAGNTSVRASMASSMAGMKSTMGGASKSSFLNKMGGGGGGGSLGQDAVGLVKAVQQPISDALSAVNARVERGAEYSLQADRMTVQLQQMYGMSNRQVRNQLRQPLTNHYLLGGGTAINDLLGMQASTGLSAAKNASTVEAFRAVSGFSYGSGDITKMLSTMGSPDVANKMFMMGGTGMYGMGGKQRSGMQSIQDIVRRTGLTNPEALKGALQQGSNTRQRLNAMGVPQDMQDMVIQYAMQNNSFQKKSGNKNIMYDPSVESDRKSMGIEETYAVQHEKTTGERLKREENFYSRQTDNYARFEKNLRLSTQMLGKFENALSGVVGAVISAKGHPITNAATYGVNYANSVGQQMLQTTVDAAAMAADMGVPGGDPVDSVRSNATPMSGKSIAESGNSNIKLSDENERKLATLNPKLAVPLRKMLEARPELHIGDAVRSKAQQEQGFRSRYRPSNKPISEKNVTDRVWNGVVWEMTPEALAKKLPAMAPPGQSMHERGLASDVHGNDAWVRDNASKFGLSTGWTGTGGSDDEPFHIQPAGMPVFGNNKGGSSNGSSSSTSSTSSVSKASFKLSAKSSGSVGSASIGNPASSIRSYIEKGGIKSEGSIIAGTDKISSLSAGASSVAKGGDPVDYRPSAPSSQNTHMGGSQGIGSITISPNIYLNGTQDMTTDLRRIAREVGALLEQEVKLNMMRTS